MNDDIFEEITNAIAVLIKNDANITAYCTTNLGSALVPQDNSIMQRNYATPLPYFVVTKGEEEHFFNKGTASGVKAIFPCSIVFVGEFVADQVDDEDFILPAGAKVLVNDIKTYTPSDVMRKIARLAGNLVNEKIECTVPQLRVENFSAYSEGYYDREQGQVGSILTLNMYMLNNGYN